MAKPSPDTSETLFVPNTGNYRRRVGRLARLFQTYRLFVHGNDYVSPEQRRAIHYFLDMSTVDSDRRTRSQPHAPDVGGDRRSESRPPAPRDMLSALGV